MGMNNQDIPIYVIAGSTASGKSARALSLAKETNGVIINADSMQIYDALPMLTSQPSAQDCAQAPHRLYGALPAHMKCSAEMWRTLATDEINNVLKEGQTPILVGGTGLYFRALMKGFSPVPNVPDEVRARMNARQKDIGNPAFHAALVAIDPVMAQKLHPNDTQRLIRAAEVLEATGHSLAYWQSLPLSGPPDARWRFEVEIIRPAREALYARCDKRFEWMIENGALDEVQDFKEQIELNNIPADSPVTNALGFGALCEHLNGTLTRDEAVQQAQAETRHYAKRQDTWFRNQLKS
jgi:tRNA dimethylallyltransferase